MIFTTNSETETVELGKKLGEKLKGGEVIALLGDLGGGKTQFTKGIAKGLGIKEEIVSPTFTIERIYPGSEITLHHFDFYRLGVYDPEIAEEVQELQSEKTNVVVIEWAKNLDGILPKDFLEIYFHYLDGDSRKLELIGHGDNYKELENL
jgi:tRNA threonylcarbamoyladenosine biosynthesis protein TsaE